MHIQFGLIAALEQTLRDLQAALLQGGILVGDAQTLFNDADRAIGGGYLRRHEHLHIVVLGNTGQVAGIGGLDAAPEFAPEINFPADIQPDAVGGERRVGSFGLMLPDPQDLAGKLLQLRIKGTAGDAQLSAGFHDAQAGGPNAGVEALRFGNQLVERWIVEIAPPVF